MYLKVDSFGVPLTLNPQIRRKKMPITEKQKLTTAQRNEDTILLLKSVIEFKSRHGWSNPSPTTMKPLFDSLKPKLHQNFDYNSFYEKIKMIRKMYAKKLVKGAGPTEYERCFFELSARAWDPNGEMKKKAEGSSSPDFSELKRAMTEYWEINGLCRKDLEVGLEFMDKEKASELEGKWKKFMRKDAKIKKARLDLIKEIRVFADSDLGEVVDESDGADESEGAEESEGDM